MDSNTFSDSEVAHLDIDISNILGESSKIESADFKMLGKDNKELTATVSYSVEVVPVKTLKFTLKNAKKLVSGWADTIDPYVKIAYNG